MGNNNDTHGSAALAFLGDAVFGLMAREKIVNEHNCSAGRLHTLSVKAVNAAAQCRGAKQILPVLSQEEYGVFMRGRNMHVNHTPKNQTEGDYHYATGLEALFGYLYLEGKTDRLRELFDIICNNCEDLDSVEKKE